MRTVWSALACMSLAVVTAGCAIQQTVKPVQGIQGREICVIENRAVRAGFIDAYRRSLASRGYVVRLLPASATTTDCAVTSTYNATWRWDLALYMAVAEIRVYSAGRQVGEARYDSEGGSAALAKFIDAEKKIEELVSQLFPEQASGRDALAK
jgi:hypothetical protein